MLKHHYFNISSISHLLFISNFGKLISLLPVWEDKFLIVVRRKEANDSSRDYVAHVHQQSSKLVYLKYGQSTKLKTQGTLHVFTTIKFTLVHPAQNVADKLSEARNCVRNDDTEED